MATPGWLLYSLAAVMLGISGYCASRLLAAHLWRRQISVDVNLAHVAMGVVMAGMLTPSLAFLSAPVWEIGFGGFCAWFLVEAAALGARHRKRALAMAYDGRYDSPGDGPGTRTVGTAHSVGHSFAHAVMAGAMVFMLAEASGAVAHRRPGQPAPVGSMPGMGVVGGAAGDVRVLSLVLAVALLVSAVLHLDAMAGMRSSAGCGAPGAAEGPSRRQLAPRLEAGCHVAMCVTMGYMLVLFL